MIPRRQRLDDQNANSAQMNPFLKAHACALHEQIHVAAWPVYPPARTLKYPDPYTNISEMQSELVTPAYAYETGSWTLAPTQLVTREGARANLPVHLRDDEAAVDAEAAVVGNGFARIYRPDGLRAIEDPAKTFDGLIIAAVDLDENLLTKRLADFVSRSFPKIVFILKHVSNLLFCFTGKYKSGLRALRFNRADTICDPISSGFWLTRHQRRTSSTRTPRIPKLFPVR